MTDYNYSWPGSSGDPLPSSWETTVRNGIVEQDGSNGVRMQNDGGVTSDIPDFAYMEQSSIDGSDTHIQFTVTRDTGNTEWHDLRTQICTNGPLQSQVAGFDTETSGSSYMAFIRLKDTTIDNISIYKIEDGDGTAQSTEVLNVTAAATFIIEFERVSGTVTLTIWNAAMDTQLAQTSLDDSASPLGSGYVSIGFEPRNDGFAREITIGTVAITTDEVSTSSDANTTTDIGGAISESIVANIG